MVKNRYLNKVYKILFVLPAILTTYPATDKLSAAESIEFKATDLERVNPGTAAPDFDLESVEKTRVKLSDYKDLKNIILIFYRGYW